MKDWLIDVIEHGFGTPWYVTLSIFILGIAAISMLIVAIIATFFVPKILIAWGIGICFFSLLIVGNHFDDGEGPI